VHPLSAPCTPLSKFGFAQLSLAYLAVAGRMPLARLSRNGLVAHFCTPTGLPPLGLPKPAALFGGDELLCELRLVLRSVERAGEHALKLTVQPSRADDHESFWRALRGYHQRLQHAALHPIGARQLAAGRAPATFYPLWPKPPRTYRETKGCWQCADEASARRPASQVRNLGTFAVERRDDAQFVAEWLEYHAAEIETRMKSAAPFMKLARLDAWSTGRNAYLQFSYACADDATHACADAVCQWICAELKSRFGMAAGYRLDDVPCPCVAPALETGRAGYSFSSK
jgi:hypothetical protein